MNDYEPEKKKGLLSNLFGGKKKDNQQKPPLADLADTTTATVTNEEKQDEAPPPIVSSNKHNGKKDKTTEELLHQKQKLELERTLERQVIQEKSQKLHVTMELNAQMQNELDEKDAKLRILEDKNTTLQQTVDAKVDELEVLKQKASILEQELSSKTAEEKKLLDENKELLANISLHGWVCKRGIKGPTADMWRKRYFKVEEGNKLMYYKTAAEGPAQGYIDIDRVVSVKPVPGGQQNNYIFHVVTEGRTYELLVHDEATMNKWISSIQYMKEWRAKRNQVSH